MSVQPLSTLFTLGVVMLIPVTARAQPDLIWETTISVTSALEGADDMVVDAAGNAIVTGYLPVERDFYVMKFDSSGDLLWSRIIGGQGLDHAGGLAVDGAGDIYLAGRTLSDDFPTRLAYQGSKNGPSDAFLMKLAGGDGRTLFSTYFGGSRAEWATGVAIGSDGSITIAGQTDSLDFETVNAIQDELTLTQCFCEDAFVTRFSAQADQILFSTYLGGSYDDVANDVKVDPAGNIYFAGRTQSDDFPTLNAAQPNHGGGDFDGFVARIAADDTLAYSTFLGGEDLELVQGLDVDDQGSAYIAGSTQSILFPTTPGAFQEEFVGGILTCEVPFGRDHNCFDMFVTKLNVDGALGYSTFIGGHKEDEPRNLVVGPGGRAHVIGYTYSDDFPNGGPFGTVVAMQLNAEGSDINYLISHDTPGSNAGSAVAVRGGDLYIAASVGLPYDTYVAKFAADVLPGVFEVVFGSHEGGGLSDLFNSDDSKLLIGARAAASVLSPSIRLEIEGSTDSESASELTFWLEASSSAIPPAVEQRISLFDFDAQQWEVVDSRTATPSDSIAQLIITQDPGRFLENGSGNLRARIDYFDPGALLTARWSAAIDQSVWSVVP